MQRRPAPIAFFVDVGSCLEQNLGGRSKIQIRRHMQERPALIVFFVDVGSLFEQDLDFRSKIQICRIVQCLFLSLLFFRFRVAAEAPEDQSRNEYSPHHSRLFPLYLQWV